LSSVFVTQRFQYIAKNKEKINMKKIKGKKYIFALIFGTLAMTNSIIAIADVTAKLEAGDRFTVKDQSDATKFEVKESGEIYVPDVPGAVTGPNTATPLCADGNDAGRLVPCDQDSWIGPQGPSGTQGEPGPKGDPSAQGNDGPMGDPGPPGTQGIQGPAGSDGKTIYSGTSPPDAGIGVDGDFYYYQDGSNFSLYGPKSGGSWPTGVNLVGAQGQQGNTGPQGEIGDDYLSHVCALYTLTSQPLPAICDTLPKTVFLTSMTYDGNLGGLAGADAKCQQLADLSPKVPNGTYKAWLSAPVSGIYESPSSRFTRSLTPYVLVDGTKVADNWTSLVNIGIENDIIIDENGFQFLPPAGLLDVFLTWTNTLNNGQPDSTDPGQTCDGFTSNLSTLSGKIGVQAPGGSYRPIWTSLSGFQNADALFPAPCDRNLLQPHFSSAAYHLYCFQQ